MTIEQYAREIAEAVMVEVRYIAKDAYREFPWDNLDAIIASVPAPDVQAQEGLSDEYKEGGAHAIAYLTEDQGYRSPEQVQAQIDAAPNGYADRAFTDAEWATRYAEKCRERDVALAARDERAPFCEKHRADEQWRGLTDCLACATEELEARVTEFDSQIDAARAEEREATWFLLYGGTSADGAGPGKYVGRTTDPEVARAHHHEVKNDPYSTGYVEIVTDSTCRRAWSADEIRARSGAKVV